MANGRQSSAPRVPTIRSSSLEREEVPLEQDPAKEHYQPYNDDEGDNRPPTPAESHISISLVVLNRFFLSTRGQFTECTEFTQQPHHRKNCQRGAGQ